MKDYNDVLPSKFGLEDEPVYESTEDLTQVVGAKAQDDYVKTRRAFAEEQWELIEKQIRLRVANCLQETLAEAKCKMKESLYSADFYDTCRNIAFDSANLTIINSKYL